MPPSKPIEDQLFRYDGCEVIDGFDFIFYDVELKVDIGIYEVGKKFSHCHFISSHSYVEFFEKSTDEKGIKFELKLQVGKQLYNG